MTLLPPYPIREVLAPRLYIYTHVYIYIIYIYIYIYAVYMFSPQEFLFPTSMTAVVFGEDHLVC